jgi:hypothetical protein
MTQPVSWRTRGGWCPDCGREVGEMHAEDCPVVTVTMEDYL